MSVILGWGLGPLFGILSEVTGVNAFWNWLFRMFDLALGSDLSKPFSRNGGIVEVSVFVF